MCCTYQYLNGRWQPPADGCGGDCPNQPTNPPANPQEGDMVIEPCPGRSVLQAKIGEIRLSIRRSSVALRVGRRRPGKKGRRSGRK
jgi:hypothetical protein